MSSRPAAALVIVFLLGLLTPVLLKFSARVGGKGLGADLTDPASWQRLASPGDLSKAHRSLDCDSCHSAVVGVERTKCVVCHANETAVLQRQPTAFHADVGKCGECHLEHAGGVTPPVRMNHDAMARIAISELEQGSEEDTERKSRLVAMQRWLRSPGRPARLSPQEALLDCTRCHSNDDRHFDLFGSGCADCHVTDAWTIPEFQHPPPGSRDCAQCHQAPPSHYMMHFKMISRRVANKPHADVRQCFSCHQTTSWPDIRSVGWYKHH